MFSYALQQHAKSGWCKFRNSVISGFSARLFAKFCFVAKKRGKRVTKLLLREWIRFVSDIPADGSDFGFHQNFHVLYLLKFL